MIKFGTDGIRGVVGKDLTFVSAMHVGSSVAKTKKNAKVLIARDNRPSGNMLLIAVSIGLILGGARVTDIGIATTPCVSYLTKNCGFDFGIEISASHNPSEYNGIKIFDEFGQKIESNIEKQIESNMGCELYENFDDLGSVKYYPKLKQIYINFLKTHLVCFDKKIAIDCANGSITKFAKSIFSNKRNVIFTATGSGKYINHNVGATHQNHIFEFVKKNNCDFGFAFDGDADRIVVVTKNKIYTGDNILFALAKYNNQSCVVGTIMSNYGLQKICKNCGIQFEMADVGDKNVFELMNKIGANFGAEPAGHVICKNIMPTGDGLLVALKLIEIFNGRVPDEILNFQETMQHQKNIVVKNKEKIINDIVLKKQIEFEKSKLEDGRIVVRASGTENLIRIMVESNDKVLAKAIISNIEKTILEIEELCAE